MSAEAFVAAARSYIGVPWKHQGRSRAGLDCIGLIILAGRDIGIAVPLVANYGPIQAYWQMKPYLADFCQRIGQAELGAIAVYRTSASLHVAICAEADRIVQALNTVGRVEETRLMFPLNQVWLPRWPS